MLFQACERYRFTWRFQESIHCFARLMTRHSASSSQTLSTANQLLHGVISTGKTKMPISLVFAVITIHGVIISTRRRRNRVHLLSFLLSPLHSMLAIVSYLKWNMFYVFLIKKWEWYKFTLKTIFLKLWNAMSSLNELHGASSNP